VKAYGRSRGTVPLILNSDSRERGERLTPHPSHLTPGESTSGTRQIGCLVPRVGGDYSRNEKFQTSAGTQNLDCPVCS